MFVLLQFTSHCPEPLSALVFAYRLFCHFCLEHHIHSAMFVISPFDSSGQISSLLFRSTAVLHFIYSFLLYLLLLPLLVVSGFLSVFGRVIKLTHRFKLVRMREYYLSSRFKLFVAALVSLFFIRSYV
jgi:hypothetical protein